MRIARYLSSGSFLIPSRHPKVQLAAESVAGILQSKRPDDDISSELAELLGFEDIDLVMGLMHNRSKLVEHLAVSVFLLPSSGFPPAYSDHSHRTRNGFGTQGRRRSNAILLSRTSVRKPPVDGWRTHWRLLLIARSSLARQSVLELSHLRKLNSVHQGPEADVLPHVYTSASMTGNNALSKLGSKYILPVGTERKYFEVGIFASSM